MTIEHNVLPNAELHEPLDVDTALVNTAYVADGVGSGTWKKSTSPAAEHRARMEIFDNSTAQSVTKAVAFPHTNSDYQTTAAFWTAPPDANLIKGITFASGVLTMAVKGVYEGRIWLSMSAADADLDIAGTPLINGVAMADVVPVIRSKTKVANDIIIFTGFGSATLNAGDTLAIAIAVTKATAGPFDVTFHEGAFDITLLQEL